MSAVVAYCCQCGESINPVPEAITLQLLDQIADDDLPDFLWQYILEVIKERHGSDERQAIAGFPESLRMCHALILLDSEVFNGGFYQFFTNSSGRFADEALNALSTVGADRHAKLLAEAIRVNTELEARHPTYRQRWDDLHGNDDRDLDQFWSDVETNAAPVLDRLDSEYYSLSRSAPFWPLFVAYVRAHPQDCAHRRTIG